MVLFSVSSLLSSATVALAVTVPVISASVHPRSSTKTVIEFPNGTWVENIAVRSNGNLLLTFLNTPELHQLDPKSPSSAPLVATFPDVLGVLGITELTPDVFAVIAGNWSVKVFATTPGSYSIWKVDFTKWPVAKSKIADVPGGSFLNGLTRLNSTAVLAADSELGVIWRVDSTTGQATIVIDDPNMKTKPGSGPKPSGVNGVHLRGSTLYFTNSYHGTFCKVGINPDGTATANSTIITTNGFNDDFSFDASMNAYTAQDPLNTVAKITPAGNASTYAGSINSTAVAGATSTAFGRLSSDSTTLYVVTNGGVVKPVAGTQPTGGKVVAVLP